jgi:monofunctional biosynthetic peptidoglycan transglycosylase
VLAGSAVILASALVVLAARFVAPPVTAFMLADPARPVAYDWVPLERIAPALAIAVVAAEDQRFPSHHGFDLGSIRKAWDERGRRVRGASTISQQVAKNLFLWRGASWIRKAFEAWFTAWIELAWDKRRILEVYLNVAEFGPGTYGAEAAARRHFGKAASALSLREAALLAAVLPNPRAMDAGRPSRYVAERARWIERQAAQLGGTAYLRGTM